MVDDINEKNKELQIPLKKTLERRDELRR